MKSFSLEEWQQFYLFYANQQSSALQKYFSKFIIQKNHLGSLLSANSDSVSFGWGLKFQIPHKISKFYPCRSAMNHDMSHQVNQKGQI